MKLTKKQREVLEREGVEGMTFRYSTIWMLDGKEVSGVVRQLMRKRLMHASYYRGGRASAWITDEGRKILDKTRQPVLEHQYREDTHE